jgi:tRNA pseudouridine38-40 synthase
MPVASCQSVIDDVEQILVKTQVALIIEYDGTDYYGYQWQKEQPTVQQTIEEAIHKLTGERIRVIAASRTDTGVHAKGQVISFRTFSKTPLNNYITGLNHFLPESVAVKYAFYPDHEFHVQRSAVSRKYEYYILNSVTRSPLGQRFSYRVPGRIDINKMQEASLLLIGEHDFASFTSTDSIQLKNTVRRVEEAGFRKDNDLIIFTIVANSFLAHQVRNTVGALLEIGRGRMSTEEFYSIMEQKKPGLAGPRAPACGLYLIRVNYPHPIEEEIYENL